MWPLDLSWNVLHPLCVSAAWTVSRPRSCTRQPLDRQLQRWGIGVARRPAANQSWRVAGAERNAGVEGVSALLVWLFEGKQARWDGMQQIKLKAAEMRVHATWYKPEPLIPPVPWHVPLILLAPESLRNLLRGKLEPCWRGLGST